MKKKNIKEFLGDDGTLMTGKTPITDPKTSAKTTTDASVKMQRQPYNWTIYNIKMQETDLPYTEQANKCANYPQKFYQFLESIGKPELFETYFEKSNIKESLKQVSRDKAYEVLETILNRRENKSDVISKTLPTIEEIKEKEILLIDKLDKIANTIKRVQSEEEKEVLLSYFKEQIK